MRAVLVVALLLAGCATPGLPEAEGCPRMGHVRSAPLEPVGNTSLPPEDALFALAHAFDVAAPTEGPVVHPRTGGASWRWTGPDRFAVALVQEGVSTHLVLHVDGTRFDDKSQANAALAQAAGRLGVPGQAVEQGMDLQWDTGIEDGGGTMLRQHDVLNQTQYYLWPSYAPPANVLPSAEFGTTPGRAAACLLAEAGAFFGVPQMSLLDDRLVLDEQKRLERLFVYGLRDADCSQREVHVRFDAVSGNLLGATLQPC